MLSTFGLCGKLKRLCASIVTWISYRYDLTDCLQHMPAQLLRHESDWLVKSLTASVYSFRLVGEPSYSSISMISLDISCCTL